MSVTLLGLIDETFRALGGVGTHAEVKEAVIDRIPADERGRLIDAAVGSKITSYFNRKTASGLPQAPAVDAQGTHMQLELFDVEQYRFAIYTQMSQSNASRRQAEKLAAECKAKTGIAIDIYNPFAEEAS